MNKLPEVDVSRNVLLAEVGVTESKEARLHHPYHTTIIFLYYHHIDVQTSYNLIN